MWPSTWDCNWEDRSAFRDNLGVWAEGCLAGGQHKASARVQVRSTPQGERQGEGRSGRLAHFPLAHWPLRHCLSDPRLRKLQVCLRPTLVCQLPLPLAAIPSCILGLEGTRTPSLLLMDLPCLVPFPA